MAAAEKISEASREGEVLAMLESSSSWLFLLLEFEFFLECGEGPLMEPEMAVALPVGLLLPITTLLWR